MSKSFFLFISLFAIVTISNAQKKAITENGDEVILYDNGTWKYTKDFLESDSGAIKTSPTEFKKNKNASFLLKGKNGNFGIWIDPKKWTFEKAVSNPTADFEIDNKEHNVNGVIITEPASVPLEYYEKIALINGRKVSADLQIIDKEYRKVNGLKVLRLQMEGTQLGLKFSITSYYYSDSNATVQFAVSTYSSQAKKYSNDIEELLNGIVEIESSSSQELKKAQSQERLAIDSFPQGANSPNNNCKKYFEGMWKYNVGTQKIDVDRTFDKNFEYRENRKFVFEYAVKWIDNCHYEITFRKTNKPNYTLEKIGEVKSVEIVEIDKTQMKYIVRFKGMEIAGEMIKL